MNSLVRSTLFTLAFLAASLSAHAALEFTTTLVAEKGDPTNFHLGQGINHGNGVLRTVGPAAVDSAGDVALQAGGPPSGILLYTGTVRTLVAHTGVNQNNPSDPVFSRMTDPVLSGSGALAFIGILTPGFHGVTPANDVGVFVYQSGSLTTIARTGDTAPTGADFAVPLKFASFGDLVVNDAGGVTFEAVLRGGRISTVGLFSTDAGGNLDLLVVRGRGAPNAAPGFLGFIPLPLVTGQGRTVDTINGFVTLFGPVNPPFAGTVGLATSSTAGFTHVNLVNTTGTTPNGGTFRAFGEPIVNSSGTVLFNSVVTHYPGAPLNTTVVWMITGGTSFQETTKVGNEAPDSSGNSTSATYAGFSNFVLNNNDQVAAIGFLKPSAPDGVTLANDTGIWSNASGTYEQVARKGDLAPNFVGATGTNGKFAAFVQLVLPDVGGPIFLATLSDLPAVQNEALFAVNPGGILIRVVGKGDTDLPTRDSVTRTVRSISIFQAPPAVGGQSRSFDAATENIVYQANFTDGTWAVYEVAFP